MPTAAKRKPAASAKPAPRQQAAAPSKAQQAAQHQGRPAPAEPPRQPAPPPQQLPATVARNAMASPAPNLPAFMQQFADDGKQNISREDMEVPRLKLMQGLSKELQAYDDLKAGHFFHPAAEHIFDAPFRAVPVFMDVRYILWRPLDSGGGILARADDGIHWSPSKGDFTVVLDKKDGGATVTWKVAPTVQASGLANWGTMNPADPNSPPAATLMYNYLLAFPDEPDLLPAVMSFQRSSIKVGRRFNTKLKTVRAPIYGTIWEFSAVNDHNSTGKEFFNIDVRGAGLVEDESLFSQYHDMYETFKGKGLSIKDLESVQGEEPDAAAGDGGNAEPADAPRY